MLSLLYFSNKSGQINIWILFAEKQINNKIFDILLNEKPEL